MSLFRIVVIGIALLVGNVALAFGEANQRFIPDDLPGSRPGADTLTHWRYKEAVGQEACNALAAETDATEGPDWKNASASEDVFGGRHAFFCFRVTLPPSTEPNRMLHFSSVDDNATVFLNGKNVGHHQGYQSGFDIALDARWRSNGPNHLAVVVENVSGPGGIGPVRFTDAQGPVPVNVFIAPAPAQPRQRTFNADWRFFRADQPADEKMEAQTTDFHDASWETVTLPHTPRLEPRISQHPFQGICWYRKQITTDPGWKGKKVFIEFGAAMQIADVWVNGTLRIHHLGGYQKFQIDLTDDLKYDRPNVIAVRLDNRDTDICPPGKPLNDLDFSYFGGLYRNVSLIVTEPIHITDPVYAGIEAGGGIFVTYDKVSEQQATVRIKTHVKDEGADFARNCQIISTLIDPAGRKVARVRSEPVMLAADGSHAFQQAITVDQPLLWHPDYPFLYTLRTAVLHEGIVTDLVITRIGIRHIDLTNRFLLNGKELHICGSNRHQEYPYLGNAMSSNAARRDARKIKDGGFNFVRLSHYPQDPAFLDACDELGILVQAPVPGWQMFRYNSTFIRCTYQDIRDLIRRDRNHPSVVFWEPNLNETDCGQTDWLRSAYEIAHAEYPGDQCFTFGDSYPYNWSGWDVKGMYREYGDFGFGGNESTSRHLRGEGEKALLQQAWNFQWCINDLSAMYHDPQRTYFGCATWVMFDYNRGYYPKPCMSGMMDIFRLPKFVYYFYQSQRDPALKRLDVASGPMVFLANFWTPRPSPAKVVVYSNCQEVELQVNGKVIRRQKPDSGPTTRYSGKQEVSFETNGVDYNVTGGNPFDGGNAKNLDHPPFTFFDVPYAPGELKAIGYMDGKPVVTQSVHTPESSASLKLEFDTSGVALTADGTDAIFVRAEVRDKNGTILPENSTQVTFTIEGPGKLIGANPLLAEAGIATILLQVGAKAGNIKVTAFALGLPPVSATITSNSL